MEKFHWEWKCKDDLFACPRVEAISNLINISIWSSEDISIPKLETCFEFFHLMISSESLCIMDISIISV